VADAAAPADQISDPVTALRAALPWTCPSPPKGELAIGLLADAYAAGVRFGFIAGDEVYGACIKLRALLEQHQQAYVLRVRSSFTLTLDGGATVTCQQAFARHCRPKCAWTIRSAGEGSKGERAYTWAWIATAGPTHFLLIRKHRKMAALAICAGTAAAARRPTDTWLGAATSPARSADRSRGERCSETPDAYSVWRREPAVPENVALIIRFHLVGGEDISVMSGDFDGEPEAVAAIARAVDERRSLVLMRARYDREADVHSMVVNLANVASVRVSKTESAEAGQYL
jgi:hypothetical protein